MAISNIPTFTDGEILTASKLNQLGTAITTKFSGAVTGADISWPLIAQGNIDLNNAYGLINLRTLWNVINADEYDSLSDAVSALPAGGGAIFIPPNTTIVADGVSISKPVCVFGAGKTSVLQLTGGATSGYLLRATGTSDFDLYNLTIDGNSATGSAQDGVQVRNVDGVRVINCWFKNFSGNLLEIGNDGTAGNSSANAMVGNCVFEGGSADHLVINDLDGGYIIGNEFDNPTGDCIEIAPSGANSVLRSITVASNNFSSAARSVYAVGQSGTASDSFRLIRVIGNESLSTSGVAYTIGASSAVLREVMVCDNIAISTTGDAFNVRAQRGLVKGNYAPSAGADGLDMTSSEDIAVMNNSFPDATARGIDATSSSNCRVMFNDVHNATTEGITKDSATGLVVGNNHGDHNGTVDTVSADTPAETGTGVYTANYVIPGNTVKVGDVVRVMVEGSSGSGTPELVVSLDGGTTEITVGAFSAAGRCMGVVDILVEALSGAGSATGKSMWVASTNQAGADSATWTTTWTSDVTITFESKTSDISLDYYAVEILGGN